MDFMRLNSLQVRSEKSEMDLFSRLNTEELNVNDSPFDSKKSGKGVSKVITSGKKK